MLGDILFIVNLCRQKVLNWYLYVSYAEQFKKFVLFRIQACGMHLSTAKRKSYFYKTTSPTYV